MDMNKLLKATGFEWNDGNIDKNWIKHGVSPAECEQMFFNQPLVVADDDIHSAREDRYQSLLKVFLVEKIEEELRNKFVA